MRPRTLMAFSSGTDCADGRYTTPGPVLERPAGREQRGDGAVVERQHLVLACLLPPELDHRGQPLGLVGGQVVGLGGVDAHVVELPHVVVERRVGVEAVVVHVAERLERHRLPTLVVDAARSEHLEVLRGVALGRGGVVEEVGEARALDRRLRDPRDLGRARRRRSARAGWGARRWRARTACAARRAPRAGRASARCRDRRRRPRAPRASSAGTACCRPSSSPTGSCCGSTRCRSRRCGRAARADRRARRSRSGRR